MWNLQILFNQFIVWCMAIAPKLLGALIVFIVGKFLIGKIIHILEKSHAIAKLDGAVRTFSISAIKGALYVLLFVTIIGIMGVPMASVVAVIASAGVAVGLALQGALSNLAGGIMLVIFKPFRVGDFVDTAGVSGTVKEVSLFYTVIVTGDNRYISVPNGTLMNTNVINYSTAPTRRVDLAFACAKSETPTNVQNIIVDAMKAHPLVLQDPEPVARVSGGTNDSIQFTARVWCNTADYWDVYFDLNQSITEALSAAGVNAPAVRIITK